MSRGHGDQPCGFVYQGIVAKQVQVTISKLTYWWEKATSDGLLLSRRDETQQW